VTQNVDKRMTDRVGYDRLAEWLRLGLRQVVLPGTVRAIGRRNAVRMARFLTNELRFDGPNDMQANGELLVQTSVLRGAREAMTIFDIGANIGDWTLAFVENAAACGRSDYAIHLFEPSMTTARMLKAHLAQHESERIDIHAFGMSSSPGCVAFHIVGDGVGVNSIHPPPGTAVLRTEQATMDTVDRFTAKKNMSHITLMKVDTEGHDLSVLKGASQLLERGAIAVVQFEYNHRWITSRTYLRDVFEIAPTGYRIGKVTPHGIEWYPAWDPELESYREGNYLLCREDALGWFPAVPWWKL
jgi:FkbM family methyltransferase